MGIKTKVVKKTDSYTNELKKYENEINKHIDYWIPVLGLDSWIRLDVSCALGSDASNPGTLAETIVDWRYMEANIDFYLGSIVESGITPHRMEYIVVHELCHCVVSEMRPKLHEGERADTDHEERVASNLARAFMRAKYKKGIK